MIYITVLDYFHAQIVINLVCTTFKFLTVYPSEQILIIELLIMKILFAKESYKVKAYLNFSNTTQSFF